VPQPTPEFPLSFRCAANIAHQVNGRSFGIVKTFGIRAIPPEPLLHQCQVVVKKASVALIIIITVIPEIGIIDVLAFTPEAQESFHGPGAGVKRWAKLSGNPLIN